MHSIKCTGKTKTNRLLLLAFPLKESDSYVVLTVQGNYGKYYISMSAMFFIIFTGAMGPPQVAICIPS